MPLMPNNLLRMIIVDRKINQIGSSAFSVKEIKHKIIGWKKYKISFASKIQLNFLLFN